eukprot:TRINITY_DN11547_c0_g1_i3.p1 TRINITY_DN11547_c0_g1~~TRINITY_DN11547_c0_g1_i3.p1  ORF type:complete len:509 (-),score=141.74 TRINITY_DN11547_c0_g1_i3:223-1749(-)
MDKHSLLETVDPNQESLHKQARNRSESESNQELPAAPPDTTQTVTVSTEAWLALRHERTQRERQIKALQTQVEAAQAELEQLVEVRAQLKVQRDLALEARRRGNELNEAALMAAEELAALRAEAKEKMEEAARKRKEEAEAKEAEEKAKKEAAEKAECLTSTEDEEPAEDPEAARLRVEWNRLLSERETTARELGNTLERIEEMEHEIEERRIQLQIASRRRERERSSLLTALRELRGSSGSDIGVGAPAEDEGWSPSASSKPSSPSKSSAAPRAPTQDEGMSKEQDRERQHLQHISELEEAADVLRQKIEAVQSRVATLNKRALTRGEALRYATATSIGGVVDMVSGAAAPLRPDIQALAEMLDRLYVENFALRGLGGSGPSMAAVSSAPSSSSSSRLRAESDPMSRGQSQSSKALPEPVPLDLSRFAVDHDEGGASDDDIQEAPPPPRKIVSATSHRQNIAPVPTAASTSSTSLTPEKQTSASTGDLSPRSKLLFGLDFKALSVAE